MIELLIYTLSGKRGITPDKSMFFIRLLKKAGVLFPFHPKYDSIKGQLVFYPTHIISDEIMKIALILIKGEGVKDAKIEKTGKYMARD